MGALIGLAIVLVGLFDNREDAFPAGRVPVLLAGAAFFAAGSSILLQALWQGQTGYRVASSLGALCGLALLATPLSFLLGAKAIWALVLGLSLAGALALAFSKAWPAWRSTGTRLLSAALLLLLAAAAGFELFRDRLAAARPAVSSERPKAEQEPPEAGR